MSRLRLALTSLSLLACSAVSSSSDGGLDSGVEGSIDQSSACGFYAELSPPCSPFSGPNAACMRQDLAPRCQWLLGLDHRGVMRRAYGQCLSYFIEGGSCVASFPALLSACVEDSIATSAPAQAVLDGLTAVCTSCSSVRGGGSADDCVHALVYNGLSTGGAQQAIVNLWGVDGSDASTMGQCLVAAATASDCGMATNRCLYPTLAPPASHCSDGG